MTGLFAGLDGRVARAVALLSVAFLSSCSLQGGLDSRSDLTGDGGRAAPRLAGTAVDGRRIDLTADRGHVVLLDFWAPWCGPCRAEQRQLNELTARYEPRGVRVHGVAMRTDVAEVRAYEAEYQVPYATLLDDGSLAAAFNVAAPPTLVVVGADGNVKRTFLGSLSGIDKQFDALLSARR